MKTTAPRAAFFGPYEVDVRSGEVRKHGIRVKMGEQPFQILLTLLASPGELVLRDELRAKLWADDTFVDFDHGLNSAVQRLRDCLSDTAEKPQWIETVPRRGYRFIGQVEWLSGAASPSQRNGEGATLQDAMASDKKVEVAAAERLAAAQSSRVRPFRSAAIWIVVVVTLLLVWPLIKVGARWKTAPNKEPVGIGSIAVKDKDSIVLADFANTTGDPVFNGALRQGLSIELEQTPFLKLVPGDQVAQTLKMMERPPDAPLTPAVAREVCQRMNATVEIDGTIASLGNRYVLGLNALNCATGETLALEQVTADSKENVLPALSSAASELRSKLGESQASLATYDVPLTQATTSSLEALQAYSQANQAFWAGDWQSAVSSLDRATQIDPNFATAYSLLGAMQSQFGDTSQGEKSIAKAYQLLDRTNAYEKLAIPAIYYFQVIRDYDKAATLYDEWARTFPREPEAWSGLGICYNYAGQCDRGLSAMLEAHRLHPSAFSYGMIACNNVALNRLDEARTTIAKARGLHIEPFLSSPVLYQIGFMSGDQAEMSEQEARPWTDLAPGSLEEAQSATAAYSGHLSVAREGIRKAIARASAANSESAAAGYHSESAIREALFGNFAEARSEARGSIAPSLDRDVLGVDAIALALAGDKESQKIAGDLNRRFPDSSYEKYICIPAARAAFALHRGDPEKAIESLEIPAPYELTGPNWSGAMLPVYLRGQAYLAEHKGAEAAAEFQKILDHPGVVGNSPIGALAHLGLGRAHTLAGDKAKARAAYKDFLALWKDADPDIPVLVQAKVEYARLQ